MPLPDGRLGAAGAQRGGLWRPAPALIPAAPPASPARSGTNTAAIVGGVVGGVLGGAVIAFGLAWGWRWDRRRRQRMSPFIAEAQGTLKPAKEDLSNYNTVLEALEGGADPDLDAQRERRARSAAGLQCCGGSWRVAGGVAAAPAPRAGLRGAWHQVCGSAPHATDSRLPTPRRR